MDTNKILTASVPVRVDEISSLYPFESSDMGSCYTIVVGRNPVGIAFAGHISSAQLAPYIHVWPSTRSSILTPPEPR